MRKEMWTTCMFFLALVVSVDAKKSCTYSFTLFHNTKTKKAELNLVYPLEPKVQGSCPIAGPHHEDFRTGKAMHNIRKMIHALVKNGALDGLDDVVKSFSPSNGAEETDKINGVEYVKWSTPMTCEAPKHSAEFPANKHPDNKVHCRASVFVAAGDVAKVARFAELAQKQEAALREREKQRVERQQELEQRNAEKKRLEDEQKKAKKKPLRQKPSAPAGTGSAKASPSTTAKKKPLPQKPSARATSRSGSSRIPIPSGAKKKLLPQKPSAPGESELAPRLPATPEEFDSAELSQPLSPTPESKFKVELSFKGENKENVSVEDIEKTLPTFWTSKDDMSLPANRDEALSAVRDILVRRITEDGKVEDWKKKDWTVESFDTDKGVLRLSSPSSSLALRSGNFLDNFKDDTCRFTVSGIFEGGKSRGGSSASSTSSSKSSSRRRRSSASSTSSSRTSASSTGYREMTWKMNVKRTAPEKQRVTDIAQKEIGLNPKWASVDGRNEEFTYAIETVQQYPSHNFLDRNSLDGFTRITSVPMVHVEFIDTKGNIWTSINPLRIKSETDKLTATTEVQQAVSEKWLQGSTVDTESTPQPWVVAATPPGDKNTHMRFRLPEGLEKNEKFNSYFKLTKVQMVYNGSFKRIAANAVPASDSHTFKLSLKLDFPLKNSGIASVTTGLNTLHLASGHIPESRPIVIHQVETVQCLPTEDLLNRHLVTLDEEMGVHITLKSKEQSVEFVYLQKRVQVNFKPFNSNIVSNSDELLAEVKTFFPEGQKYTWTLNGVRLGIIGFIIEIPEGVRNLVEQDMTRKGFTRLEIKPTKKWEVMLSAPVQGSTGCRWKEVGVWGCNYPVGGWEAHPTRDLAERR